MPVAIVQVVNNTSRTVNYQNTRTGYKISVPPRPTQWNPNWLPSSSFSNDTTPFRGTGRVEVWLSEPGDNTKKGPTVEISDHNWQFSMVGPVSYSQPQTRVESWHGNLSNGGQYILRLDEAYDGRTRCAFTFLRYRNWLKFESGYITSQSLGEAAVVAGLILMAIFW
ncbi:hypothetical protein BDZ97DRAFT_1762864 [Flammula alnicola]|nr:hypothetical protein BDZ97DRAFT_1762864 [Flammula alnicola]